MTFVSVRAVVPSIYPLWTDRLMASMSPRMRRATTVIDNTETNRGVAASWNIVAEEVIDMHHDWLVILSSAMRMGHAGGNDFIEHLAAADDDVIAIEVAHGIGWHMIAFRRQTLERVGLFDENFWPAYFEDIDYGRRVHLAYGKMDPPWWPKVDADVSMAGMAHGITLGKVDAPAEPNIAYYVEKWGGMTGHEQFETPYNEKREVSWWRPR